MSDIPKDQIPKNWMIQFGHTDADGVDHITGVMIDDALPPDDNCRPEPFSKKTIAENLRWDIFERDNFTCQHCGSRRHLTVDHIKPEIKGGTLDPDNLQTLCKSCNSRKGVR